MAQKKTFKADLANPAMQFISTPADENENPTQTSTPSMATVSAPAPVPEGYKANPLYIETKSKRVQLLMQPSLYNKIKEKANKEGCSVNDTLHRILEEALRK